MDVETMVDGVRFVCRPEVAPGPAVPAPAAWHLPVGDADWDFRHWGVRGYTHDLRVTVANPNRRAGKPHPHTGYDLNWDRPPYGDVEIGAPVYAVTDGVVTYTTAAWSGAPMLVMRVDWEPGVPAWFRYAHVTPFVAEGDLVRGGQAIGAIARYPGEGAHLHWDGAWDAFAREWCVGHIRWFDPAELLRQRHDPERVAAMLRVGD